MADPISLPAGILAVITAALQTSKALYRTVESFKSFRATVRQLTLELKALVKVLESLSTYAQSNESYFESLRLPLTQCSIACADFEALLAQCTRHSNESRTSFRDWTKLRYMDGNVADFTAMLAGYKSTISIALADVNLRLHTVTHEVLHQYQSMIQSTAQDLEDHLEEINHKLAMLTATSEGRPATVATDLRRFQSERESTKKCLEICGSVLSHIRTIQLTPSGLNLSRDTAGGVTMQDVTNADVITISTLYSCCERLEDALVRLSSRALDEERDTTEQADRRTEGNEPEINKLRAELESTKQNIAICAEASQLASSDRVHVLEDVRVGDDGRQMLIATLGELFSAKGVTAGDRAIQVIGSMSPSALHELIKQQGK